MHTFPPADNHGAQKFPMRQVTAWWPETPTAPVPWGGRSLVCLHQRLLGNVQEERTGAAGRVPEGSGDAGGDTDRATRPAAAPTRSLEGQTRPPMREGRGPPEAARR